MVLNVNLFNLLFIIREMGKLYANAFLTCSFHHSEWYSLGSMSTHSYFYCWAATKAVGGESPFFARRNQKYRLTALKPNLLTKLLQDFSPPFSPHLAVSLWRVLLTVILLGCQSVPQITSLADDLGLFVCHHTISYKDLDTIVRAAESAGKTSPD